MLKWLLNVKIASTLGFCILIALIWFVGPYFGIFTRESRLTWIFAVMFVWVLTLLAGRVFTVRASAILEKVLRQQADEAVMAASAGKRAEIARLRQRMLAAIDTVKSSNIGKARGKAALYELPWYMIIGHPAAGKSSAILHSGLTFPFGDKQAVQGVGGTRDCDWFFSTEGVLLDTAGRYATQREDRPEWLGFLKMLKKYRAKAPVNGILVAVSLPELAQYRSEQFAVYAQQARERINEIDNAFDIKVPVYLVFTKLDLLGGFAQFFEDLTEEQRHQVWGTTLSHDQGSEFDAKRVVLQQFDELYRGLVHIGAEKLANKRDGVTRAAHFAFPIEFNAMREPIGKFIELLFQQDPYHAKPLLRGFYFTSALQEGTPRIDAGNRVSNQFDLAKPGFDAAQLPTSNGFFLRNLFREVLFLDQHLVTAQIKLGSTRWRAAGIAAGMSILVLISGALTWAYIGNQKLIAAADEELQAARSLSQTGHLFDKLKALQILQLRMEQLYRYRKDGHPFQLGMSLYHGDRIEHILRAEYFAGIREIMLTPVKDSLEHSLTTLDAAKGALPNVPHTVPEATSKREVKPRSAPIRKHQSNLPVIPIGYSRGVPQNTVGPMKAVMHGSPSGPFVVAYGSPESIRNLSLYHRPAYGGRERIIRVNAMANVKSTPLLTSNTTDKSLEEEYNALKTYLMLSQRERMDMSHLSDQIPKYWRAWLEANKGKAAQEEVNRVAERIIAFYVSQITEPDLPLISVQPELVASSREALRGALHKLSAIERAYNELKARANTQFSPMTVGRILDNKDLSIIAGSYAVPGAFTRDAWDKYFRNAIAEVSTGEVKADDWVLETQTQDDLGKNGDGERNRAALEALYKADYIREWKKFLQGVAIQEFGTLENTADALARLADTQNSGIKQILARVAYETAWDNPSHVSKSIESAKSSVISRTEKLVLGKADVEQRTTNELRYGEVGEKFAFLSMLVEREGEGKRTPLSAYLEMLGKIKAKVGQVAASGEQESNARQIIQATLNGNGSELADALALVDGTLLGNAPEETKEIVRPLLVRPLIQTFASLIPPAERGINQAWRTEVLTQWRTLANKYPFADSSNEASMAEISKFLKPQEGILPRFIEKHLAGLLVQRGDSLIPRTWANLGVKFSPAFLNSVIRLNEVGNAVLQEGEGARFEIQPVPTPGLSEIMLEIDGQILRYRNGPQAWTGFTWPNPARPDMDGARIQVVSFTGVSTSVANFTGRLSLMRLFAQAKSDHPSNSTVQLEWHFKSDRSSGNKLPADEKNGLVEGGVDVVRLNFRMVSGANPLALSGLRRVSLPDKITN